MRSFKESVLVPGALWNGLTSASQDAQCLATPEDIRERVQVAARPLEAHSTNPRITNAEHEAKSDQEMENLWVLRI